MHKTAPNLSTTDTEHHITSSPSTSLVSTEKPSTSHSSSSMRPRTAPVQASVSLNDYPASTISHAESVRQQRAAFYSARAASPNSIHEHNATPERRGSSTTSIFGSSSMQSPTISKRSRLNSADSEPRFCGTNESQAAAAAAPSSVPAKKIRRSESLETIRVEEGPRNDDVPEAEKSHQYDRVYTNVQSRCSSYSSSNSNNSSNRVNSGVHDTTKGYRHTEAPLHPEQEEEVVERSIEDVRLSHSDILTLRGRVAPYRIVCPQNHVVEYANESSSRPIVESTTALAPALMTASIATTALQRPGLPVSTQSPRPQCVIRTVESAPGTGHRVSSITFEHKPRRNPPEAPSQQQPPPPPTPLPSLSLSEPAMASESDDSDQSMGSSLSSPPSSSSSSPTLAKPIPAITATQPILATLTGGADNSRTPPAVFSTGVEHRSMLATLRTRSGKTPVNLRLEGADAQELRSLKQVLPLNEDVQRTFILLAELARSETWEKKSKFPTRLRAPLFKCAKVALLTRSTGYLIEDNFFVHLQTIMPYNKFTLRKLIYKNILPAWLRELEVQKVTLVAKFRSQVLSEGVPPSGVSLASENLAQTEAEAGKRTTFMWTQGLRLLLWEIMEKYMEIRASMKELCQIDSTTFPASLSEFQTRRVVYDEILACFPQGWIAASEIARQYLQLKEKITGHSATRRGSADLQDFENTSGQLAARHEVTDVEQNCGALVNPASGSLDTETSTSSASAAEKPAILDTQNSTSVAPSALDPVTAPALTEYRPISPADSPESAHATLARSQPPVDSESTMKSSTPANRVTQMEADQVEAELSAEAKHTRSGSGTCPQNPVVISDSSPIERRQSFHASAAQRVPIVLRRQLFSEPAPTTLVASAMGSRQKYPLHHPSMFPLPLSPLSPLTSYDGSATGAEPSHGTGSVIGSSSSSQSRGPPPPLSPNPIPLSAPVHQAIYDALLHAQGGPTKRIRRPYSDPAEMTEMMAAVQERHHHPYVEMYPSQHPQEQPRKLSCSEHEQYHPHWQSPPPVPPPQQHQQQPLIGRPEYVSVSQRERVQIQLREQIQMRQQDKLQQQIKEQREKQHRIDRERRLREQLEQDKAIWEREQLRLAMLESDTADQRAVDEAHEQQQQHLRVLFEKSVRDSGDHCYEQQEVEATKPKKKKKQVQEDEEEDDEEERKLLQEQEKRVQFQAQKLLEEQTRLVQLQQQKEQKKAQLKREERQRLVREAQQRRLEKQQQQTLGAQQLFDLRREKDRIETDRKHKEKQQQIKARWETELEIKLRMMQSMPGFGGIQEAAPKAKGRPRQQQQQSQQLQRLLPKGASKQQQPPLAGQQRSQQFRAGIVLQSPKTAGRQLPPSVTSSAAVTSPIQYSRPGLQSYSHESRAHPYHPLQQQNPQQASRPSQVQPAPCSQDLSLQQQQQRQQQAQRQHQSTATMQSIRELSFAHSALGLISGPHSVPSSSRNA